MSEVTPLSSTDDPETVAGFLSAMLDRSGKTQREIASAIGYGKPNMITMLKQGVTKIPLVKVAPLAEALGVDPVHFLRKVMIEYNPTAWEAIEKITGAAVTENERKMLAIIREATNDLDPGLNGTDSADRLRTWGQSLLRKESAADTADVSPVNSGIS